MANRDVAIQVTGLQKYFILPHETHGSVKSLFLNGFRTKRTFEKQHVLKGITFEVQRGEFFGILGRNGSGKSTLLKILGGIYEPTEGKVEVNGTLTPFIELGIGFNPDLTGRENVFLNGAILGLTRKEVAEKYEDIVSFSELEMFMDQKLKNYSSGMQIRLAFSIAMQAHNDILLIDEVLAVGDASFQRKCFEVFKDIKKSGKTVIFVTHDMSAVREYCDRAVLIEKGQIISSGNASSVANDYLQIFNDSKGKTSTQSSRWGDGKVQINQIDATQDEKLIHIKAKVEATADVNNPIFGVIIKDSDGNHIYDNNTKWKNIKTGKLSAGDKWELEWSIPNILRSGTYRVTIAAAHEDGLGFYDWREDVAKFQISKKQITAGMIIVDDRIEIRK